ncbi:MAG: ATP-binding protein [Chloroflexi bacterium]|nr:ATP-binding protein [Chloroflexota bacterium]
MFHYFAIRSDQLPYLVPYFLSAALMLAMLAYLWRQRANPLARYYGWVIVAQFVSTVAYVLEIAADELAIKAFWDDLQWGTLSLAGILGIYFTLHVVERPPRNPLRFWVAIASVPVVFSVLIATNSWTELVRTNSVVLPAEPFSVFTYTFTPITYLYSVFYLLGLGFVTIGLLVAHVRRTDSTYRSQAIIILIGVSVPIITGLFPVLGISLMAQRDITPIAFAISNVIVAWGLLRYRLFDLVPIARDKVFENIPQAVIVLDMQLRVVDVNPAGVLLIGQEKQVVIGRDVRDVLAPWFHVLERYLPFTGAISDEFEVGQGAERRFFALSITPIFGRDETQAGWIAILRNITERRLANEQLRQQSAELLVAKEMAEQANHIKSQFLASMSHELRTPLNAIINFTEMVAMGMIGPIADEQADLLNQSLASSRHLLNLINDVLDISKIQSGKLSLFVEHDVVLKEELTFVLALIEPMLHGRPIQLVTEIDPDLPIMSGDKRRIRQILLNLLSNAAKFTDEGTITLRIQNQGEQVLLTVIDEGLGISPQMQTTIFEPFVQTEDGVKQAEGTGLGLPITKSLAEAHGGRIWLESTLGQGSAFYVALPIKREP